MDNHGNQQAHPAPAAPTTQRHVAPPHDEERGEGTVAVDSHAHPTCPTCGDHPDDYVSLASYRKMMSLVRLQTTIPITVLISMGTMLICGVVIHPGMREINSLRPTLLTPNNTMLVIYWSVYYAFSIGFCVLLIFAHSERTRDLFIKGVGLRFAVSNCLIAGWAVCWTLRMFTTSAIFAIINMFIVVSINVSLLSHPPSIMHPFNSLFVHGTISLLLAMLWELTWMHNGFVALKWVVKEEHMLGWWTWEAVACVAVANAIAVFWEIGTHAYMLAIASEYILFSLLFASVRINPSLPDSAMPKPVPLLVTIIIFLVLHPIALVGGGTMHLRQRQGEIRLPSDEEEDTERAQRERDIEAEVEARVRAREGRNAPPTGNLVDD